MAYKSKAVKNFESRLQTGLEFKDFDYVERLFALYGAHLELCDDEPYIHGERGVVTHVFDHTVRSMNGVDLDYYRVVEEKETGEK